MTDYLDSSDLATRLGIKVDSVHRMRHRGDLPNPDRMIGRSPAWLPATIDRWQANRPGHGWRGRSTEDQAVEQPAAPVVQQLPAGDIHFDGETLSVGGVPLTPGRYRIGDTDAHLEVHAAADEDDDRWTS